MANLTPVQLESTANPYANGTILEARTLSITSDGATITATVSASVGTDLTFRFSDGLTIVDFTTPKTVVLTAGSDTVPLENYLYFLQSDPTTLVASASGFPATEYAPIGRVIVQSATGVQANGVLKQHDYTDHVEEPNSQGHMTDVNAWIREQWATWLSGVAPTITGSGTGTVTYAVTSGVVRQLHSHAFPAIAAPADVFVINDNTTPYNKITNIGGSILADSTGASLTNKFYNLVIWAVASESGTGESKLFVNLPNDSYNTQAGAELDANLTTNYSIPTEYKGTGFLIQRIVMRNQTDSTFTVIDTLDLRGQFPNAVAGTSSATATIFPDSTFRIFNNADNTKEIAFDASALTTSTTRTYTMPDDDGTIALASGLAGGQTIYGGTASGDDLTLESTSHGTKGDLFLQPNNAKVTIGSALPGTEKVHLFQGNFQTENTFGYYLTASGGGRARIEMTGGDQLNLTNPFGTIQVDDNIGVGGINVYTSAAIALESNSTALLVSRQTTAQKTGLTAVNGMILYDTDLNRFQKYENGSWTSFADTDLWTRVTGTPNYLIPETASDDLGATGVRINKGWFTNLEITNFPQIAGAPLTDQYLNQVNSPSFANLSLTDLSWSVVTTNASGDIVDVTPGQSDQPFLSAGSAATPIFGAMRIAPSIIAAAAATPVDSDVSSWNNDTIGIVRGTGGRIWFGFKNSTDVYYVEATSI